MGEGVGGTAVIIFAGDDIPAAFPEHTITVQLHRARAVPVTH